MYKIKRNIDLILLLFKSTRRDSQRKKKFIKGGIIRSVGLVSVCLFFFFFFLVKKLKDHNITLCELIFFSSLIPVKSTVTRHFTVIYIHKLTFT